MILLNARNYLSSDTALHPSRLYLQQFDISVTLYRNFRYLIINISVIFHVSFSTDFGHLPSTFIIKIVGTC